MHLTSIEINEGGIVGKFTERKVGKWVVIMDEPTITFDECKCSECGVVEYFNKGWKKFNYCPNCGTKMMMEEEDDAEVN